MSKYKDSVRRRLTHIETHPVIRGDWRRTLREIYENKTQISSLKKQLKETNRQLRFRVHQLEENHSVFVEAIEKLGEGVDTLANAVGYEFDVEPAKEETMVIKKVKKAKNNG